MWGTSFALALVNDLVIDVQGRCGRQWEMSHQENGVQIGTTGTS